MHHLAAPPGEWGEADANGTYNGLLGMLQRGEKDISLNYFTVTRDRIKDFDMSPSYFTEGSLKDQLTTVLK